MTELDRLFRTVTNEDILFEEDCLRNAYHLKSWMRYLEHKKDASFESLCFIYERALQELPKSYKLWKKYLELRISRVLDLTGKPDPSTGLHPMLLKAYPPTHPEWQIISGLFEKAMILCNKFPIIWRLFCLYLMHQPTRLTYTRRTFDRALKALPVTQHHHIWDLYLLFAKRAGGETAVRVWRRYLRLNPSHADDYVDILLELDPPRTAEAARVLATILENPAKFASSDGKTMFQYWSQLCDLVCENPERIQMPAQDHLVADGDQALARSNQLDVDRILRAGIARFTDQVGRLWNGLARWWILRGEFERARDVFEEAIHQVTTLRDFSLIFDAYAKMEEDVLSANMERLASQGPQDDDADALDEVDIDLRLARFEKLMERRPFLLNDVLLRQNPHNVQEWSNRINLHKDLEQHEKVIETFEKALDTIAPHRVTGKLQRLWVDYALYYESREEFDEARAVFERATQVRFKAVDDLAFVWCEWAEMELRHDHFKEALAVIGRATSPRGPSHLHAQVRYNDESKTPQQRLFKSSKLWAFYVDLEESLGTVESTRAVYDRILELKIATPQIVINYAAFLEDHKYYEESFRTYQRGIELFGYPIAFEIWNLYLTKFINRYGGSKIERTRDLFEHALDGCPPKFAKPLYLLYAKLEEDHGLARHAMRIYDRATKAVSPEDAYEMFTIYIAKATSFFGLVSTREIYEKALEALPDIHARNIAVRFHEMEIKLGEVDRARAILGYSSQFCDPRTDTEFWKIWHDFEVKYGNEDTFKEMLRIKRSVQAKYNTDIAYLSSQILAARAAVAQESVDSTIQVEDDTSSTQQARMIGFVRAEKTEAKRAPADEEAPPANPTNPDEINISEEESDEDEATEETGIAGVQKAEIPAAVFGGLASKVQEPEEKLGALDRIKRKRD